jgi:hypothetical protein
MNALRTPRTLRQIAGLVALLALVMTVTVESAGAARTWCRYDPVIRVDGQIFDVWLTGDADLDDTVTGPTRIVVTVPVGAATELLAQDLGFGRLGYHVTFVESAELGHRDAGPQVRVDAFVPATKDLAVAVHLDPRSVTKRGQTRATTSEFGTANTWLTVFAA